MYLLGTVALVRAAPPLYESGNTQTSLQPPDKSLEVAPARPYGADGRQLLQQAGD